MKCIHCQHDSKLKERDGGKCPNCKHPFAFEPASGDKFTDMAFQKAVDRVSAEGKVRWALDHLFYEVLRSKRRGLSPWIPGLISLLLFAITAWIVAEGAKPAVIIFPIMGLLSGSLAIFLLNPPPLISRDDFLTLWSRFIKVHGTPASLVVPAVKRPAPSRNLELELSAYSFDRAVICDRPAIVDVLLANQFHFENNCAILGVEGYPGGIFPIVMNMLRQNPQLNIFVIHDASVEGCQLARKVRTSPEWFAGIGRVVDVGLRPAQAKHFKGLAVRFKQRQYVEPDGDISADEAKWLRDQRLELTAVRPEQLIKQLFRAISGVEATGWGSSSSDGGSSDGVIFFGGDASTSDGGGDSFG